MKQICVVAVLAITVGFLTLQVTGAAASTNQTKRIYTHDFITATNIVGRYYGSNVRNWLQSCSSSEGGHGGWVWFDNLSYPKYGYSNTPGGWMQFMGGTFYSNVDSAFRDARHRGLRIHPKARSYYEPLGQAVVAAYMYKYYGNPGTWTGARC